MRSKMKLSQKRTCNDCYALERQAKYSSNFGCGFYTGTNISCSLGYAIQKVHDLETKPIEPCPKPRTMYELVEANKKYSKKESDK